MSTGASSNFTLQILHASDFEAGLLALQRAGNFAAIVDRLEDEVANSITLSSGDGWLPSPFYISGADPALRATYASVLNQLSGLTGAAAYQPGTITAAAGRADILIQNIIGVQAAAFGNHEFDAGTSAIRDIIGASLGTAAGAADDAWAGANFPYLSTNLDFTRDTGSAGLADLYTPDIRDAATFATGPTSAQTGTGADKIARSTIITENGQKIGVIGATTQILPNISSPGAVTVVGGTGDNMALLAQQINAEVDRLKAANPDLNKIVVLAHLQQIENERALAPLLRDVDVLIAGGNHSLFADGNDVVRPGDTPIDTYPVRYTNASGDPILLVNTAAEYGYVGRLVVDFDAQGRIVPTSVDPARNGSYATTDAVVSSLYGGNRDAAFANGTKGDLVQKVLEGADTNGDRVADTQGIADVIRAQDGNTFGRTSVYLEGRRNEVRTEETNFGNLSADANLWYARRFDPTVQVSIKNGGGIRDSIGSFSATGGGTAELPPAANPEAGKLAGQVSQLDIANSLRFNNTLSLVTVTAAELERTLEHAVAGSGGAATPGQFAQVSGVSYAYDTTRQAIQLDNNGTVTREGERIRSLALVDQNGVTTDVLVADGRFVGDPGREIRMVTLSFLAAPGSGTPGLGGDRYPLPAFGDKRVDLATATPASALPNAATFSGQGTEQDAAAEYLAAVFNTRAFGQADTAPAGDVRIQNVAARTDNVVDRGFDVTAFTVSRFVTGSAPTAARVETLAEFAESQAIAPTYAGRVFGAYEALGLGFSETADFQRRVTGLSDDAFVRAIYQEVFGRAATTAQANHFNAQLAYFEGLYARAGVETGRADTWAKGVVAGQMLGHAVFDGDGAVSTAAQTYLSAGSATSVSLVGTAEPQVLLADLAA